jgi:UDP:flavonoid glycosyltransferase YjiC (YdhE family)
MRSLRWLQVDARSKMFASPSCISLTQDFVPAKLIASMVDVVVAHGGQGTVQNALAAGTPIVGVAMQWEQEFNLDQVVKKGAAIRIPKDSWTVATIRQAVTEVLETDSYQLSARCLQQEILALQKDNNSAQNKAAKLILSVARESRLKNRQAGAHNQSVGA